MILDKSLVSTLRESYLIVVPIFFAVWWGVGWVFKEIIYAWIRRMASRTKSQIDDIFLDAANTPIKIFLAVIGLVVAHNFLIPAALHQKLVPFLPNSLKILTVLGLVLFVDRLFLGLVKEYSIHHEFLRSAQNLLRGFVHILVFGIGGLIVLDSLGISITPIIASLGIGSLGVALALQPTLENLFAGFQIVLDQPVRPGHYIRLESGEDGYVERVGWRSTWIRQLPNNTIIIPNSQLVNSRVLNYYYPSRDLAVVVDLGVHYSSDLDKVERVTVEVAEHILKTVAGAVKDFKPFIRYNKFDSSSINFSVILRAEEFVDHVLIRHEFIKALSKRFVQENIVIPFPITAINTSQEEVHLPLGK